MQLYNLISTHIHTQKNSRGNYFLIVCPLLRFNEARNEELSENRVSGKNNEFILNVHLTANLD